MTDLDARCFIKRGGSLVAADFAAEEFLHGIPEGREVVVSVRRARSPKHHRWFFAMLRKVIENTDDRWGDENDLLDDLKIATGHRRRRVNILTNEVCEMARSVSFAAMPEDPFRRFRDRCLYVISKATGIDPVALMAEVDAAQGMTSAPYAGLPVRRAREDAGAGHARRDRPSDRRQPKPRRKAGRAA